MIPPSENAFRLKLGLILAARAALGVLLVFALAPVCVDDYFRTFHADWWWDHVGFTTSYEWTPGYLYVYGPLVGLSGDMILAPRLLTAALALATAYLVSRAPGAPHGVRLAATGIAAFAPLALVLGTVPLTEALFVCLLLGGAVALRRYLETGDARIELAAAALYLGAAAVRYEGFVFAAAFTAFALARRPRNAAARIGVAAAFVPWIFPAAWVALEWAVKGSPLWFLGNVRDDHFGAGDLGAALVSAEGAVSLALAAAAVAASGVRIAAAAARRDLKPCVLELHAIVAAAAVAVVVASGNTPSQYPLRLLYPVIALGALPLAAAVVPQFAGRPRAAVIAAIGAVLAFAGAGMAAVGRPPGIPAEDLLAAAVVRARFASGALAPGDHVVVEHDLPSAAAILVYANRRGAVHIDALGDECPPRLLESRLSVCPVPPWAGWVRAAVVRAGGSEERYVIGLRWARSAAAGSWRLYVRPPGAPGLPDGQRPWIRDPRTASW